MKSVDEGSSIKLAFITTFRAFAGRDYRFLWMANFLFYQAMWMEMLVLGWLVVDITGSPFMLGIVVFVRMGVGLYISIAGGVLLDRFNRKKLAMFVQVGNVSTVGVMAFLLLTDSLHFWQIIPIVLAGGIFGGIDFVLRRTLVSDVVDEEHLTNALALEAAGLTSGMAIGPLLGGVIITFLGVGQSYVAMLLMYSLGFFMLMSLNIKVSSGVIVRESAIKSFLHGFDYVTRHSVLFPAIGVTLVMNMFVFTHTQLLPIFAKEILLVGSTELGVMASAIGVGALIGTLIQASLGNFGHRGMVYLSGSTITILSALLFSASAWFGLSLVFLFIFGLGLSAFHSMQGAILLSAASSDMRGRTMSILMFGIGAGPVGTLIVGRMALEMGAPLAIRVSAGIGLILFLLIVISSPKLRGYS